MSGGFEIAVETSPVDVGVQIGGVDGAAGVEAVMYGSRAQWDAQPQLVARSGTVYVYADGGGVTADGRQVPAIKVGDGTSYLIDMPFTTSALAEHLADASAHVSAADRALWDSGARYAVDVDGTFRLG